jgi:hypothetical protein
MSSVERFLADSLLTFANPEFRIETDSIPSVSCNLLQNLTNRKKTASRGGLFFAILTINSLSVFALYLFLSF